MNPAPIQKNTIISVSVAHVLNDMYMNLIPVLLPFLVAARFKLEVVAFAISTFTFTSSLLQPVLGYLVDQKNQRWMVYVGTLWMAVLLSCIGLAQSQSLLFWIALLAGLGTAAFHPQASAMVSLASGHRKGFYQAIFGAAGNVGWALTPLLVIPLVQTYGLGVTPAFALPGALVALWMWLRVPPVSTARRSDAVLSWADIRATWPEFSKLILVIACRSLTYFGLIAFLPLYLQTRNISLVDSSHLLFIMLFSGAMGGVCGGYLADRLGRKVVIVGSLVLATPLFLAFLYAEGPLRYVLLPLAGAFLLASFSATVVLAQEIFEKNAAMASGFALGFGIGAGGLGVGLVGLIAAHLGLGYAIHLLIVFPLVAALLALFIKERRPAAD